MTIFPRKSNLGGGISSFFFAPAARARLSPSTLPGSTCTRTYLEVGQPFKRVWKKHLRRKKINLLSPHKSQARRRKNSETGSGDHKGRTSRAAKGSRAKLKPGVRKSGPPKKRRNIRLRAGRKPSRHFAASSWEGILSCKSVPIGRPMFFFYRGAGRAACAKVLEIPVAWMSP